MCFRSGVAAAYADCVFFKEPHDVVTCRAQDLVELGPSGSVAKPSDEAGPFVETCGDVEGGHGPGLTRRASFPNLPSLGSSRTSSAVPSVVMNS